MRSGFTTPVDLQTIDTADGPLRQTMVRISIQTRRSAFYPLTQSINNWLDTSYAGDGVLTVFIRHTSASLTIQENADPSVQVDLLDALDRFAPQDHAYKHNTEGPDDMPAHIRSLLTATSLTVPVIAGKMDLGTWQDVYLIEHRAFPHQRTMTLHYLGT